MKRTIFVCAMAVMMGFLAAVGLCVRAINGVGAVSAFDTGLKVVIDAGHGGIDGGVTGKRTGKKESDINLEMAYVLSGVLQEMGFDVTLTRKTTAGLYDTTAKGFKRRDMEKRREIIRAAKPDFVLSIHQNFYPISAYRGGQAFYALPETENAEDAASKRVAEILQAKMNDLYAESGVKARQAMRGDFFILRCYDCPSVLLECGFLSNAADEVLLCQNVWRKKFAKNIAAGLVEYLVERSA